MDLVSKARVDAHGQVDMEVVLDVARPLFDFLVATSHSEGDDEP
jgi:hypothetical protein